MVDGVTKAATRWLVAALVALLAAWVATPTALPVFDGIGQPDEPYRYVEPPPTAKTTKTPTTASSTVPVREGRNVGQFVNSAESGPQISVYVATGALAVPPDADSVRVTATPLGPEAPLPTDGDIVTNVYRVAAVAGGAEPNITGRGTGGVAIDMRAPTARQPGPVFERRTADGWEQLKTIRSGVDVYHTDSVTRFGEFALVQLDSTGGGRGVNYGLLLGGVGVLLVAGVIVVIRTRRASAGPVDEPDVG
jgi:hypothetical protein